MSGMDSTDWHRKALQLQNQNLRGTNQSSGLSSIGPRAIDKGVQVGGLTGGGIGAKAINTDQVGNIQTSTHLNLQHSVLPLVSDATIMVETFSSPNFTADIQIYGIGGVTTPIAVHRPDGSIISCFPAGAGTGWDLGHDFVVSNSVYLQVYYDVFFDGAGNGRFVAVWKNTPFSAAELAIAFKDGKIPFLSTPGNTNTHLTAGTSGTYTNSIFSASGSSGGAGTAGITSIAGEAGPAITLGSSDSSVIITPVGNNIDLKTTTHGTVTSVGLALPGEFTVSGTPVIASGTLTGAWASQIQNKVFSAPSGSTGTPTFRLLVASDIPNLPASIITSGQLALARGGVNADLSATGGTSFVLRQSSAGAAITVSQLAFSDISGSVAAAQLPNPTASTLGGIESLATVTSKWINTISTSGVPSATQPASTDMSDISTGTWTPVIAGQTTAGTQTYSTQAGNYTVIGDIVFISCTIVLTAFDGATAGNINVTGLPFTVTNTSPTFVYAQGSFCANVSFSANYTQFISSCNANTTRINLYEFGSGQIQHRFQPANMTNTSNIVITGWYRK